MITYSNSEFKKLPGLRLATEEDFRTLKGNFKLNLEYYEFMCGYLNWELQVTDEETNREWLKSKIGLGFIYVPVLPVYWNQNPDAKIENELLSA